MDFTLVKALLQSFPESKLSGIKAHHEIAPYRTHFKTNKTNIPRKAAVLILVYPLQNTSHFALIQRPKYDGSHSGQIAFPGGKWEDSDINLEHTALREADEETNIKSNEVNVLGNLSQIYIPPSNFEVTPILGLSENRPLFKPDQREVEEIIEVPLAELLDDRNLKTTNIQLESGKDLKTPCFSLQSKIVWGATAMILNELKYLIKET